jgi:3',5'-cyclic AMP phosphodiesterase CpdA
MEWLKAELAAHANKLILLAIHHPLHKVAPIDNHPDWGNFVCDNGPDILALLDQHPQVKVVLTGHHHLTRVNKLNQRLHIASPSICVYPCSYRTLRLNKPEGQWQLEWQTHRATDEKTSAEAHRLMLTGWQGIGFEADFVKEMAAIAFGRNYDRSGTANLSNTHET